MRHVDLNKILSPEEKQMNETKIAVFYDKHRKYKRHADGLQLIKRIVEPLTSSQRMRQLSPEMREKMDIIIKRSYDKTVVVASPEPEVQPLIPEVT